MEQAKYALIIGGNRKVLRNCKSLNLKAINIIKEEQDNETLQALADKTVVMRDYEDLDALEPVVKELYEKYHFPSVISLTETGLTPAAYMNEKLGLKGVSLNTVRLLRDKMQMRRLLNEKGISPLLYKVGSNKQEILDFLNTVKDSIILKPVDGCGSLGIYKIQNEEDVDRVWQDVKELGLQEFLLEEYIDGSEVSVEAFSYEGKHNIIGITDKVTQQNFVEIGHSMPSRLNKKTQQDIIELVKSFLDAINLQDGPSHTEIKISSKGLKIIESHNRIGGDKIGNLVNMVYDVNMILLTFDWLVLGNKRELENVVPKKGIAIRFFTPQSGIIKSIRGIEQINEDPDLEEIEINVRVGDKVKDVRHSNDRAGYLMCKGKTPEQAISNCETLLKQLVIEAEE